MEVLGRPVPRLQQAAADARRRLAAAFFWWADVVSLMRFRSQLVDGSLDGFGYWHTARRLRAFKSK